MNTSGKIASARGEGCSLSEYTKVSNLGVARSGTVPTKEVKISDADFTWALHRNRSGLP